MKVAFGMLLITLAGILMTKTVIWVAEQLGGPQP